MSDPTHQGLLSQDELQPQPELQPEPELQPHRDPAQWSRLVDRLEIPVILVVISGAMSSRLKQELTTEDIWQETLVMAWRDRNAHEWRGLRGFRAWLLGIAKNRIRDTAEYLGAQKRGGDDRTDRFSAILASGDGSIGAHLPPGSTTPSRIAGDRERARAMEEALTELPEKLAGVVRLRIFEELPMRKVAERLGIGLTTANERFFHGASLYQTFLKRRLGSSSRIPGIPSP
jgi:RNA polymerase sigma factor (sigma-70 family)